MSQISNTNDLLLEIARCPIAAGILADADAQHACSKVVRSQNASSTPDFQVPEPWNGNIEHAPILFVSSNPSFSEAETYPTSSAADEELVDFFTNRFDGRFVKDGTRGLESDGTYSKPVRFWSSVKRRTEELLPDTIVIPGVHYALTELVHCKSRNEVGVRDALGFCTDRYIDRILATSNARLVVALGKTARSFFSSPHTPLGIGDLFQQKIADRERLVVALGHPSSGEPQSFKAAYADRLLEIQQWTGA